MAARQLQTRQNPYRGGKDIIQARVFIGVGEVRTESEVFDECQRLYGAEITRQMWWKWKQRVRASDDSRAGINGMSEATRLLLWVQADQLRGNRPGNVLDSATGPAPVAPRKQLGDKRLAAMAINLAKNGRDFSQLPIRVPQRISPRDLKSLIVNHITLAPLSGKTFTRKGLRTHGVKFYTREQAIQIIRKFPNSEKFNYV